MNNNNLSLIEEIYLKKVNETKIFEENLSNIALELNGKIFSSISTTQNGSGNNTTIKGEVLFLHFNTESKPTRLQEKLVLQISFEFSPEVSKEPSFIKVIKPTKFSFFTANYSYCSNASLIDKLYETNNPKEFSLGSFKNVEDFMQNLIINSVKETDSPNWHSLGNAYNELSFGKNIEPKDVILHKSLIPALSNRLSQLWNEKKKNIAENLVNELENTMLYLNLNKNLSDNNQTTKKMKI